MLRIEEGANSRLFGGEISSRWGRSEERRRLQEDRKTITIKSTWVVSLWRGGSATGSLIMLIKVCGAFEQPWP